MWLLQECLVTCMILSSCSCAQISFFRTTLIIALLGICEMIVNRYKICLGQCKDAAPLCLGSICIVSVAYFCVYCLFQPITRPVVMAACVYQSYRCQLRLGGVVTLILIDTFLSPPQRFASSRFRCAKYVQARMPKEPSGSPRRNQLILCLHSLFQQILS